MVLRAEKAFKVLKDQFAFIVDRRNSQLGAFLFAKHLPGNDVGVVLHRRDDDLIPRAHVRPAICLGHKVDGFRCAAHEYDFAGTRCVQEILHCLARILEFFRCPFREVVHAAVDVGVVALVVADNGINDCPWLLRGGGIVQINQRMPVDLLLQYGKIGAHPLDVKIRDLAMRDLGWVLGQSSKRCHLTSSKRLLVCFPFVLGFAGK